MMGLHQVFAVLMLSLTLGMLMGSVKGKNTATVDGKGNIVWPPLPPGKPYLRDGNTGGSGGLSAFYGLSRSFIGSSLPEMFPYDKIEQLTDGKHGFGDVLLEFAKSFIGYVTCLVIGVLFIVIFPLVGLCFCCCRCCGNCGGKMLQEENPNSKCWKQSLTGILLVLVLFQGVGVICAYVTNDQISNNINSTPQVANDVVTDLITFIDNVDQQFHQIIFDNIDFVTTTIKKDTAKTRISTLISKPLVEHLNKDFNLDGVLNKIKQGVDSATRIVQDMETTLTALKSAASSIQGQPLSNKLNDVGTSIGSLKNKLDVSLIDDMQNMVQDKLQTGVDTAMNNIHVQEQIDDMMNKNVRTMQSSIGDAIKEGKAQVKNLNIDDMVKDNNVKLISKFDKYRNYGGVGIASILLLIVLLQGFGLVFGLAGFTSKPTERGCVPNAGGNMLMASVGFFFIFGAIIMLLTTLLYGAGSLLERYGCQTFRHPERIEQYGSLMHMNVRNLKFAFQGKQLNFSLSGILSSCEKDMTLYDAMHLGKVLDIPEMLNKINKYKGNLIPNDFATKLHLSHLGLSNKSGKLGQQITQLEGSRTKLNDVEKQLNDLKTVLTSLPAPGTGAMISDLKKLGDSIMNLKPILSDLPKTLTDLTKKLKHLDTDLATNATTYIKESVRVFTDHIFEIFHSFGNDTMLHLHKDLGKCRPVWNIYNALLLETICHGIIDPLNGFWLSLGWFMFFGLPALVLSVKLAKYFRRMDYDDEFGYTRSEGVEMSVVNYGNGSMFSNKVGHLDA